MENFSNLIYENWLSLKRGTSWSLQLYIRVAWCRLICNDSELANFRMESTTKWLRHIVSIAELVRDSLISCRCFTPRCLFSVKVQYTLYMPRLCTRFGSEIVFTSHIFSIFFGYIHATGWTNKGKDANNWRQIQRPKPSLFSKHHRLDFVKTTWYTWTNIYLLLHRYGRLKSMCRCRSLPCLPAASGQISSTVGRAQARRRWRRPPVRLMRTDSSLACLMGKIYSIINLTSASIIFIIDWLL